MKKLVIALVAVVSVFTVFYAWTHLYRYDKIGNNMIRTNQVTGTSWVLLGDGWQPLQSKDTAQKSTVPSQSSTATAASTTPPPSNTPPPAPQKPKEPHYSFKNTKAVVEQYGFAAHITGEVINDGDGPSSGYGFDVEGVLYDQSGAVVATGKAYLSSLKAGGSSAFDIRVPLNNRNIPEGTWKYEFKVNVR